MGGYSLAFCTAELQLISVFTGILALTCGISIACLSLHVTVYALTTSVRCQSDAVFIPGSHIAQLLPNCLFHIMKHSWVMCNQSQHWSRPFAGNTPFDIPNEEFASLNHSYSLLKVVFTWAELLNMCGMRWRADFVISISSLQKPTNLQRLNRDLV